MAKSRVNSSNNKPKMKVPKWTIALAIVLVVAIAGYAIVRFSEASSGFLYGQLRGGDPSGRVQKNNGVTYIQVHKTPVYATFNSLEGNKYYCVVFYATAGSSLRWILNKGNSWTYAPPVTITASSSTERTECREIGSPYYGPYTVTVTELNPDKSYVMVRSIYLRR